MNIEIFFIVAIVVGIYFIIQPIRTKYNIEKFKPLIIVAVLVIPILSKGGINEKSLLVLILSVLIIVYAIWKTFNNFKKENKS